MDSRESHGHGEGLGAARPRRRRLPVRDEVDVRPLEGEARRQARLPPVQRGRVRARHVQGPAPHRERPAPAPRGDDARELRPRREARVPLHPGRDGPRRRNPECRRRGGPREGTPRDEHPRLGRRPRDHGPPRRRRVHLRRGDRAHREPRGQARPPADQAAVPGRRGRVGLPDRRQQRRDAGLRQAHPRPRGRLVQGHRPQRAKHRPEALLRLRARREAGRLRGADRDPVGAAPRDGGRRARRTEAEGGDPGRRLPRRYSPPRRSRVSRWTSTASSPRSRCSARRASS